MVFVFLFVTYFTVWLSLDLSVSLQTTQSHAFSWPSNIPLYLIFFLHSSVDGHLGCFHVVLFLDLGPSSDFRTSSSSFPLWVHLVNSCFRSGLSINIKYPLPHPSQVWVRCPSCVGQHATFIFHVAFVFYFYWSIIYTEVWFIVLY